MGKRHQRIVCQGRFDETYVVRVQVVADIRVHTGPCAESLQLALGLRHVTVEKGEIADILGPHFGVRVDGVKSLVAAGGGPHRISLL